MNVLWQFVGALFGLLQILVVHACDESKCKADYPNTYPNCDIDSCEPCSEICWSKPGICSYWITRQFCPQSTTTSSVINTTKSQGGITATTTGGFDGIRIRHLHKEYSVATHVKLFVLFVVASFYWYAIGIGSVCIALAVCGIVICVRRRLRERRQPVANSLPQTASGPNGTSQTTDYRFSVEEESFRARGQNPDDLVTVLTQQGELSAHSHK